MLVHHLVIVHRDQGSGRTSLLYPLLYTAPPRSIVYATLLNASRDASSVPTIPSHHIYPVKTNESHISTLVTPPSCPTILKDLRSRTTQSAPASSTFSTSCVVVSPNTRHPAALPARIPDGESSTTITSASAPKPNCFFPIRYPSGSGLPCSTSSAVIRYVGRASDILSNQPSIKGLVPEVTTAHLAWHSTNESNTFLAPGTSTASLPYSLGILPSISRMSSPSPQVSNHPIKQRNSLARPDEKRHTPQRDR